MKLLYDFFPILLFFIAYKTYDIFVATAVAIVAAFLQVTLFWLKHRRFEKMHLVSLAMIAILGGLTLISRNNTFIMWKPTAINWLFAAGFGFSHFIGDKTLVERMLGKQVTLPAIAWTRLNLSWIVFFIISGALNIYVAYHFSEATWVNFKLFGLLGLTIIFILVQAVFLARYMPQNTGEESDS